MTLAPIRSQILALADEGNAAFVARLIPGLDPSVTVGARNPALRRLATSLRRSRPDEAREFLAELPPALVSTWGAWCVTLASILFFSAQHRGPQLHVWLIIILLSITVPITTALLARAALFRGRQAGQQLPPALQPRNASPASAPPPTRSSEEK